MLSEFNHSLIKPLRISAQGSSGTAGRNHKMHNLYMRGFVIIGIKVTGVFTLYFLNTSLNLSKTPANIPNNT